MSITIAIRDVLTSPTEQVVILEAASTTFGVFDGYKSSSTGGDRFAVAQWMEGRETDAVVSAFVPESIEHSPHKSPGIYPNPDAPRDFQHHTFSGVVTGIGLDMESIFGDLYLFGGTEAGDPGVKRAETELQETYLELALDGESVYVEVSEEELPDISTGDTIEVTEVRTDLVGFVAPEL